MNFYDYLLEPVMKYDDGKFSDEDIMQGIFAFLEDEIGEMEPFTNPKDGKLYISRLGIINSILNNLLPEHKVKVEVRDGTVLKMFLSEE